MNKNRTPKYLRVSLLSACNLQCSYCLPPGINRPTVVAQDDKLRSAIRFLHGSGINKVRFTGGEPTLYKGLSELISFVKSLNEDIHVAITSNGVLLNKIAEELALAGLDSINISLDTLDPDKFKVFASQDYLKRIISGIDRAAAYINSVKLNSVLIRGVNDDETEKLILFAESRGLDIRFIEFMPNRYSAPGDPRFISSEEIRGRLPWDFQEFPNNSSSAGRYYTAPSLKIRIGFISSVSHPFCESCDRIRLAANGLLYACLYESSNINLFELLMVDPDQAQTEYIKLLQSKQFGGCHGAGKSGAALPSFSAIGG